MKETTPINNLIKFLEINKDNIPQPYYTLIHRKAEIVRTVMKGVQTKMRKKLTK